MLVQVLVQEQRQC